MRDQLGQHLGYKGVRFLSFHFQLLGSLTDQVLQIGGVLLQHAQHGVDDVSLPPLAEGLELQQQKLYRDSLDKHRIRDNHVSTCLKLYYLYYTADILCLYKTAPV